MSPGTAGTPLGWLVLAMPRLSSGVLPAMASSKHVHMEGRKRSNTHCSPTACVWGPGGTQVRPQPSAWPSQGEYGLAGPLGHVLFLYPPL